MRAVAFDAMGVLYETADDMRQLLIPFARGHGSALSDREMRVAYRRAMLGELSTRGLWTELGVEGDARELDREYLQGYRLVPGVHRLLDEVRERGLLLGCISNDVAEWSLARRALHGLDGRIGHWTISSEIRARKPDEQIFRAFLSSTGLAPDRVVFVDDRSVNVQAAAALGFQAILVDFAHLTKDSGIPRTIDDLRAALAEIVRR